MFVKKAAARRGLQGHWHEAMAVQGIVLVAELILLSAIWWMPRARPAAAVCVFVFDLLLLSPLKAGKTVYFDELAQGKRVSSKTLVRFYTYHYEQTVGWRAVVWVNRLLWSALLYLPALVVFACSDMVFQTQPTQQNAVLSMALFGLGVVLVMIAAVSVEVILFRFAAVPYLLADHRSLRKAFAVSKQAMKGQMSEFLLFHLDHAYGWVLCFAVFPWFYTSVVFQTAKAATIRRFLKENSAKNTPYRLQHQKKCGRMGK